MRYRVTIVVVVVVLVSAIAARPSPQPISSLLSRTLCSFIEIADAHLPQWGARLIRHHLSDLHFACIRHELMEEFARQGELREQYRAMMADRDFFDLDGDGVPDEEQEVLEEPWCLDVIGGCLSPPYERRGSIATPHSNERCCRSGISEVWATWTLVDADQPGPFGRCACYTMQDANFAVTTVTSESYVSER